MPESITKGQPIAQLQGQQLKCFAPQYPFAKYGKSQQEICTIFPNIGKLADDICIIRSMHSDAINHDPAHTFMNTGTTISGRPSMGSWLLYGLGSDAEDLPGFVVMTSSGKFGQQQPIAARMWNSGFLPSKFQGVPFRSQGDAVLYLSSPPGVESRSAARRDPSVGVARIEFTTPRSTIRKFKPASRNTRWRSRCKRACRRLMDISGEPAHVLEMYGTKGADGSFAANCLLARRLAERGVRFIQLYHRDWDHHNGLKANIKGIAGEVDQATWALVSDLKQRGHARRHADRLGRRIRPHADGPRRRPRSSHQRLFAVDGRRRNQRRHHPRRDRRIRLQRRETIAFTPTISTPRCCACSASTTPG